MLRIREHWGRIPQSVQTAIFVGLLVHAFGFFAAYGLVGLGVLVKGDAVGYVQLAENLVEGRGFVVKTTEGTYAPETFRLPGLPILIAIFLHLGLGVEGFLIALTVVSAIAIPLAVWYVARLLFDERVAVVAAWLVTIEPLLWILSWSPITEIPFLLFALASLVLYVRSLKRVSLWDAIGAGICAAVAVYMRPAGLALFAVGFLAVAGYYLVRKRWPLFARAFATGFVTLLLVVPWLFWMHAHTGVYALSGTGWRNVYTDYLASVRTLQNNSNFSVEKNALKDYAKEAWGLERYEINSPRYAHLLRDYALNELARNPITVLKLESILLVTYTTQTDYYTRFSQLGFLPNNKASISASQELLRGGLAGIPVVFRDMQKRYFIPVIERLWAVTLLALAVVGVWTLRAKPVVWVIVSVCAVGALTATAIGLGVEGRLRVPVLPLCYMLTASGAVSVVMWFNRLRRYEKH